MKANVGDGIILECKVDEVFVVSKALNGGLKITAAWYACNDPRPDLIVEKELSIVHQGHREMKKPRGLTFHTLLGLGYSEEEAKEILESWGGK
jgi:hypothetical protein